ncbi:unnamed protein product [Rhizophagus irregularis]|nr:unnamed protein product [Rhizophagus irregularis]
MAFKYLTELSSDYKRLFEEEIGCDVIIYAGEEPNIKEIHAHSNILCNRSQYFRTAFSNVWAEKKDGKFILRNPNISPHLFMNILRFIYCGNIELKNIQNPEVLKLLILADELNIQQLISYIQEYLIEHQIEFLQQNPIDIIETIYQHESFTNLRDFWLEKICEVPEILFYSDKFIELKAPLLELLIKRDDLNMDEIEIWEGLLKWCFSQQNVINDPTKWSESLQRFIPLIRFYDIESADFFYKVYCHKEILPQDLIHNLLEFHLVPNMEPKPNVALSSRLKFNSALIKSKNILLKFASWIDRKDSSYDKYDNPYKFKLLYRSDRDGFNNGAFHKNCDDKGATIWIAKIQGTKQLVGGYNPLDWNGNDIWKSTTDSFLFYLKDEKDISTAKLGYVNNAALAIYCDTFEGPSMGELDCADSNEWTYRATYNDYPNINIPETFIVEHYEVFQVKIY